MFRTKLNYVISLYWRDEPMMIGNTSKNEISFAVTNLKYIFHPIGLDCVYFFLWLLSAWNGTEFLMCGRYINVVWERKKWKNKRFRQATNRKSICKQLVHTRMIISYNVMPTKHRLAFLMHSHASEHKVCPRTSFRVHDYGCHRKKTFMGCLKPFRVLSRSFACSPAEVKSSIYGW